MVVLVPMARVEIIGPKNRFFEAVSLLHEQGKLHIEDLTKKIGSGEMPIDKMDVALGQASERERMEDLLIRVRAIIKALQLPGAHIDEVARQKEYLKLWKLESGELSDEVVKIIDEVEERTAALAQSQSEIENEISLLGRYEPILHKIQPLARQIVTTGAFDSVALLIERRYKGLLEQLKEELDTITHKQCDIVSTDVDEDTTAAIVVFSRTYSVPVHKFLAMENVNQIRLPSDMQGLPFDQAYDSIRERRKTLPDDLKAVRLELESMSAKWYLRLATVRDVLTDKIDEIATIPKFGQTEYAFVITGWIPASDLSELESEMQASFGMDVIVRQLEIDEKDFENTPVALKNSKALAPFEFILKQRGTPRYGTLDATWMLFVFYPLFFGMIVGDIGYGLVMLSIVLWMRSKFKVNEGVQLATSILGPACTAVIVFGVIYGEGVLQRHQAAHPRVVDAAVQQGRVRPGVHGPGDRCRCRPDPTRAGVRRRQRGPHEEQAPPVRARWHPHVPRGDGHRHRDRRLPRQPGRLDHLAAPRVRCTLVRRFHLRDPRGRHHGRRRDHRVRDRHGELHPYHGRRPRRRDLRRRDQPDRPEDRGRRGQHLGRRPRARHRRRHSAAQPEPDHVGVQPDDPRFASQLPGVLREVL